MDLGLTLSLSASRVAAINTLDYLLEYTSGNIDLSSMGGRYATSDANSDGIYVDGVDFNSADISSGPINLVPPSYTSTPDPPVNGTVVTRDPGVWIYRAAGGEPVITLNWVRNNANIAGETGETYTVDTSVGDDVLGLAIKETATNADGTVSASGTVFASSVNTVTNNGTAYVTGISNTSNLAGPGQRGTIIYRVKKVATSVTVFQSQFLDPLWHTTASNNATRIRLLDNTNTTLINAAPVLDNDPASDFVNIWLSFDTSVTDKVELYENGVLNSNFPLSMTSTANAFDSRAFEMHSNLSAASGEVQTQYVALYDDYLDCSVYYSDFFFADGNPKLQDGIVNSVNPLFVSYGDAADHNAGTFAVGSGSVGSATYGDVT